MRFYSDAYMCEFKMVRAKVHVKKDWDNGTCYHTRIDKKWKKRFGYKKERLIILHNGKLFAHPDTIKALSNRKAT